MFRRFKHHGSAIGASAVRAASGRARGLRGARRGSVLVLILGTVAMIAVVTVAYVAVGRGDRRAAAVVVQQATIDRSVDRIADYLADVVARDAMATYVIGEDQGGELLVAREACDYPSISSSMRSIAPFSNAETRFDPIGSYSSPWPGGFINDPRTICDPFLATSGPEWLDASVDTPLDPNKPYLDDRDWRQISAFAPDGRPVNLVNLRGNFDARSGFGTYGGGGNQRYKTSARLTIFDPSGNHQFITDPNVERNPATWWRDQRDAFRPTRDPNYLPSAPEFAGNQWADTDGDGMLDARWFELIDATSATDPYSILPVLGRYRWVVAARCEDLSGRVNVNSATDLVRAPTRADPIGLYPAEIDLRRLLALVDAGHLFGDAGYSRLEQPADSAALENYESYAGAVAFDAGRLSYNGIKFGVINAQLPATASDVSNFGPLSPDARSASYTESGGGGGLDAGDISVGGPYALDDLLELLTFNGLNNPLATSRLEKAGGDWVTSDAYAFDPLRSNRTLSIEAGFHDGSALGGQPADGIPDEDALYLAAADPRRHLTTLSGANQRLSDLTDSPTSFADEPRRVDAYAALDEATTNDDPARLFEAYVDSLLPYVGETLMWSTAVSPNPLWGLVYGRDPELALRAAAWMTTNAADAFDDDDEPTGRTLLIDGTFTPDAQNYPFWTRAGGRLELDSDELPTTSDNPTSRAVTLYGIERQPFLIQATSFTMYADAPDAIGGDQDWGTDGGGIPPNQEEAEIRQVSIDGTVDPNNDDFMLQMVAFQLTNPFDEPVSLSGNNLGDGAAVGGSQFLYYIEFAGRYYKLAERNPKNLNENATAVVLDPGETMTFYVLPERMVDIQRRWERLGQALGTPVASDAVERWIDAQLTIGAGGTDAVDPVFISEFDPTGGAGEQQLGFQDIFKTSDTGVVRLWRAIRPSGSDSGANERNDDLLADRLRDPAAGSIERELNPVNYDIVGTNGGTEDVDDPDNHGFSIVLSGTVRRPDNGGSDAARGSMPVWCVESGRWQDRRVANKAETEGLGVVGSLRKSNFNKDYSDETFSGLLGKHIPAVAGDPPPAYVAETIAERAKDKTGNSAGAGLYRQNAIELPLSRSVLSTPTLLRPADMLLPLAIGPAYDPAFSGEQAWITLSEALAAGSRVAQIPPGDPVYSAIATPPAATSAGWWLDQGRLVLNDYVPIYDNDLDGELDANDLQRYPGIPLALNVINTFQTLEPRFGNHRRPTFGAVNINTAPVSVLRLLPMFSPTSVGTEWWLPGVHDSRSDVAAMVAAYRDKAYVLPRDPAGGLVDPGPGALDFRDGAETGRLRETGITAIRELPGFLSVGELLCAKRTVALSLDGYANPHNIDRLGDDEAPASANGNLDQPGLDTYLYKNTAGQFVNDDIADDYDERLTIANAALNGITVRSDFYAIWFVVHGYQRTDTENLADDEPMLPTVAKRFVMVIDRTGVTNVGTPPRIVLLRELPYSPRG